MYSEQTKQELYKHIVKMVHDDHTLVEILLLAIQHGIHLRLKEEINTNADLASGIATMVQRQSGSVRKNLSQMQPSLNAALRYYEGAPVSEAIKRLIDEHERNGNQSVLAQQPSNPR